jgi:hypothetical protein
MAHACANSGCNSGAPRAHRAKVRQVYQKNDRYELLLVSHVAFAPAYVAAGYFIPLSSIALQALVPEFVPTPSLPIASRLMEIRLDHYERDPLLKRLPVEVGVKNLTGPCKPLIKQLKVAYCK